MMKKILMSVYAACALLVIIGSLLWFVFTLYSDSAVGKTEALKNFKIFAQHTGGILSESIHEADSARLQVQLEQLCRNYSKYVQAVLIRDNAGIVFIWPKNTDIFSYNEQYIVEVKNLPLFFTAAQTHIPVKEMGTTVTVHAALQMLPLETVFNRGQIVFFLLLLIVLMTVIVLIFSYINPKSVEKKSALKDTIRAPEADITAFDAVQPDLPLATAACDKEETASSAKNFTETDNPATLQQEDTSTYKNHAPFNEEPTTGEQTVKTHEFEPSLPLDEQLESLNRLHIYDDEQPQQTTPESQEHAEHIQLDHSTIEELDGADTEQPVSSNTEPNIQKTADTSKSDVNQSFGAENYGFFENHTHPLKAVDESQEAAKQPPITTFENTPLSDTAHSDSRSLEQATLIEELTTAITETAVAEEDLTLMLIHAPDLPHNQQIIHLLRSTLDRIHKIFIFNKDTLGIIIFYAPLDQAMQIASSLYDEIHALLDASAKKSLGIGLTTRAGRLIPAPRMIEEASAAIGKATEEGGDPIVAFRVNPDKYRRCLARLN
ncbi:diguanylate cyclase [Treponema vincentii]|uniref:diguanylate cyclase n=1 Tax=Treponema TaxID=157 RepID=UPI001BB05BD3|nr:diguanylate cyclase [Treponema vincentii]QUY18530.1 diguanylate cyclase [Treponema vincentii]